METLKATVEARSTLKISAEDCRELLHYIAFLSDGTVPALSPIRTAAGTTADGVFGKKALVQQNKV